MTLAELRELLGRATERPWFDAGEGHVGGTECVRGNDGWPEPMPTPVADSTEADAALIAALRNAAPALIRVAKAAREWRAAYLADGDDEEPPFITKLDIAAGELCDAVRALKGEG